MTSPPRPGLRIRAAWLLLGVVLLLGGVVGRARGWLAGLPESATTSSAASPADCAELREALRAIDERLTVCRVLDSAPLGDGDSVVLAVAADADPSRSPVAVRVVGVFIRRADGTSPPLLLDTLQLHPVSDFEAEVRYASADAVLIGTVAGTYRNLRERFSYSLGPDRQPVARRVEHAPMQVYGILPGAGVTWFLATEDEASTVLVGLGEHDERGCPSAVHLASRIGDERIPIIRRAWRNPSQLFLGVDTATLVLSAADASLLRRRAADPEAVSTPGAPLALPRIPTSPIHPAATEWQGPGGERHRFFLAVGPEGESAGVGSPSGVAVVTRSGRRFHPLPPTPYSLFQQFRPEVNEDGISEHDIEMVEIGAAQRVGDRIWLGLSFYDGEGQSGIGGLGYFDLPTRQYHITYPREIAPWSASAIHVSDAAVWLGLVSHPEGADVPGGLARYGRADGSWKIYDVPEVIVEIVEVGERLYLATTDGIFVLDGDELTEIGFRRGTDGEIVPFCERR